MKDQVKLPAEDSKPFNGITSPIDKETEAVASHLSFSNGGHSVEGQHCHVLE